MVLSLKKRFNWPKHLILLILFPPHPALSTLDCLLLEQSYNITSFNIDVNIKKPWTSRQARHGHNFTAQRIQKPSCNKFEIPNR
jgi:hypothetical protein